MQLGLRNTKILVDWRFTDNKIQQQIKKQISKNNNDFANDFA